MIEFLRKVFLFSYCRNPDKAPYGLDLRRLMNPFRANSEYMENAAKNLQLDMVEFAHITLNCDLDSDGEENRKLQEALSDSFRYVVERLPHKFNKEICWIRYFDMSLQYCNEMRKPWRSTQGLIFRKMAYNFFLEMLMDQAYCQKRFFMDIKWEQRCQTRRGW